VVTNHNDCASHVGWVETCVRKFAQRSKDPCDAKGKAQ
jgi:hypothetical protein